MRLAIITVACLLFVLATASTYTIESTTDDILSFGARIPGTAGNRLTRDYIIDSLNDDWEVKIQKSHQNTPIGELEFQNIIATYKHNNDHAGKIVLAAHYDSKIIPGGEFLGATDSVVPISIILNLAKDYVSYAKNSKYALQLIFFDGEEAIEQWSDSDSLYGSKHLAHKWSENGKLSDIKLFILLDLIGTKDCRFPNFDIHKTTGTNEQYDLLRSIETSLRNHNNLKSKEIFFNNEPASMIQDDHLPFMPYNVPILHLISYPFPSVWHTLQDDASSLDWDSIHDIAKILRIYLREIV